MNKVGCEGIKYLDRDALYHQLKNFTKGMAVTKDKFEMLIPNCKLEDIEWNHMDQMHRPTIHNTYEKGIRIACGERFAVSLTQWAKWPFFITVTDVYVEQGVFYQSLSIAGIIFVHSIITMEVQGDGIKLVDEWFIASKRIFKPIQWILNKKLHKLNYRLQIEDEPVRQGRFFLRKKGYRFNTDSPDYLNSNLMKHNTRYPIDDEVMELDLLGVGPEAVTKTSHGIDFLVKCEDNRFYIWPAVCPHEGGPLSKGSCDHDQITCPWHGLKFMAVQLSQEKPMAQRYGFNYELKDNKVYVVKLNQLFDCKSELKEASSDYK
ncbi:MAG TPA: Rieske (2Fe-2S) protein [Gammaproteobacteria bacterium]|nr:Rieske (2Fe-2S) protein [Gammaproteobacteria bacterium]